MQTSRLSRFHHPCQAPRSRNTSPTVPDTLSMFPIFLSHFSKPSLTTHNHQFPNWATVTCIFCRFLHISISSPPIRTNLVSLESPCQHESTIVTSDGFGSAVVPIARFLSSLNNINISLILSFSYLFLVDPFSS